MKVSYRRTRLLFLIFTLSLLRWFTHVVSTAFLGHRFEHSSKTYHPFPFFAIFCLSRSQVRGFCRDLSNPDVFETTNVYGDIIDSDIHHMFYGHYSYGHQGGVWINNKMHDNIQYGFDPHDDSDYLTIANNEVYGNGNHGIIASKLSLIHI